MPLEDDLLPYYQQVKEADAVVLGSPIHFGTISATMLAFISRLWGFHHVNFAIKQKSFILALSGLGADQQRASDDFRQALKPFLVKVVDVVKYCSVIRLFQNLNGPNIDFVSDKNTKQTFRENTYYRKPTGTGIC